MPVTRLDVIQSCLDLFENPSYLEVGVWKAKTFAPARASHKVAVDPTFPEGVVSRLSEQRNVETHEITSDAYFGALDRARRFDVIYLDGLHTFEQTLRDLLNAILFTSDPGIIIVDDVYPDTYHGSLANQRHAQIVKRAMGSDNKNWMGDVYRLTFFIDTFLQQFTYRMVSDNHGQLVLWRKTRPAVTERTVDAVSRIPFEQIFVDDAALHRRPLREIVDEIRTDFAAPGDVH